MTFKNVCLFVATLLTLSGIWKFVWVRIHIKGYKQQGLEGESFYDFLCRYYADEPFTRFKKDSKLRLVFNSKVYKISLRLQGLFLVLLGVALFVLVFHISHTEYGSWLDINV